MNLNKIFLIGRLTQEPEMRSTPSGQTVTTLRIATNRVWTDQASGQKREATEYHTIIAWSRLGEIADQYLRKGGLVMIEGRIQTRSWVGQDNIKRYTTEIVAENLQLGPRTASGSKGESVADIKSTTAPQKTTERPEPEIPIIDENELPSKGATEETGSVKNDLPF